MQTRESRRPVSEEQALNRLAALCAKGEHSSGEMLEKMRRWQLPDDARQRVLSQLVELHYVDDARYAEAFIEEKIRLNGWGRRKIEQALWAKGVDRAVSAPLLDAVDDASYLDRLIPLLKSKWPTIKAASDYERSMKLINYALGRGFDLDVVHKAIDRLGVE